MSETATVALTAGLLAEFLFVLWVAPRITTRRVRRELPEVTASHVAPALRDAVAPLLAAVEASMLVRITKTEAWLQGALEDLLNHVPTVDALRVAFSAELNDWAKMQKALAASQPDPIAALRDDLRAAMRDEITNAVANLPEPEVTPEDAAQALGRRAADRRLHFQAQEEQFRAAVQQGAGAPGLLALDALADRSPKTYRDYSRQGVRGAQALAREADNLSKQLGIALPKFSAPTPEDAAAKVTNYIL